MSNENITVEQNTATTAETAPVAANHRHRHRNRGASGGDTDRRRAGVFTGIGAG